MQKFGFAAFVFLTIKCPFGQLGAHKPKDVPFNNKLELYVSILIMRRLLQSVHSFLVVTV